MAVNHRQSRKTTKTSYRDENQGQAKLSCARQKLETDEIPSHCAAMRWFRKDDNF